MLPELHVDMFYTETVWVKFLNTFYCVDVTYLKKEMIDL